MKKTTAYLLGMFFLLSYPMQTLVGQDQDQDLSITYAEDRLIVTYQNGITDVQKAAFRTEFNASLLEAYPYINGELWRVNLPFYYIDPDTGIEDYLEHIIQVQDKSNKKPELNSDVDFSNNISNGNTFNTLAPPLNEYNPVAQCSNIILKAPTGSKSVLVGFIDTGIEPQYHTSVFSDYFDMSTSPYKYNAIDPGQDPIDTHGHGTRMAGATCGVAASLGYSEMELWVAKVFDNNGTAWLSDIIWAIDNAKKDSVDLLNLSASLQTGNNNTYPQTFEDALNQYINNGGLPICSAGNSGSVISTANPVFPASLNNLPGLLVVGASNCDHGLANWSNSSNTFVDIASPGEDVLVPSLGGNWVYTDGTSIATAIVTAVGVITASNDVGSNGFNNSKVLCALINSVTPDPALNAGIVSGGYINAPGARQYIMSNACVVPGSLVAPNAPIIFESESATSPEVSVAPNPFSDNFQLQINTKKSSGAVIRLFNVQGQLLFQQAVELSHGENHIQIQETDLPTHTGLLFLQFESAEKNETIRLIRQE